MGDVVKPAAIESRFVILLLEPETSRIKLKLKPEVQQQSDQHQLKEMDDKRTVFSHGSMLRFGRAAWQLIRMM